MKPGGQELLLCFESKHIIFIMQAGPVWEEGQSHCGLGIIFLFLHLATAPPAPPPARVKI